MSCQKPHEVQQEEVKGSAAGEGNTPGTNAGWGLPNWRASIAFQWVRGGDPSPQHLVALSSAQRSGCVQLWALQERVPVQEHMDLLEEFQNVPEGC